MKKGNSPNSKNGLDRELSVPGAFKLDPLQPVKPILFFKFPNFALSYWGPSLGSNFDWRMAPPIAVANRVGGLERRCGARLINRGFEKRESNSCVHYEIRFHLIYSIKRFREALLKF